LLLVHKQFRRIGFLLSCSIDCFISDVFGSYIPGRLNGLPGLLQAALKNMQKWSFPETVKQSSMPWLNLSSGIFGLCVPVAAIEIYPAGIT